MKNINIDKLIESCNILQRHTDPFMEGCLHSSVKAFDACMRAFDRKVLPAEAVTFKVYLSYPVSSYGEATIHRDGRMEIRRKTDWD